MPDPTAAQMQRTILSSIPGVIGVHDPRPLASRPTAGTTIDAAISTDRAASTPDVARAAADAILAAHPDARRVRLEVRRIGTPPPADRALVPAD